MASIYSSSLDETENHLQKCQYDARGAVYQLLLDRAMADLKQRSSSRSSSFGSIKRRPGPSGSSQVYREQKPSEQLDEDKMRKTRSSHGKGNSGSKTAKDGKSKEVVKNDGDQGVGDKDNQEIMRGKMLHHFLPDAS